MKKQQIYKFYWFGTCLRFLQDASEHHEIKGEFALLANMKMLFEFLDDLDLKVSERVAYDQLADIREELENAGEEESLSADQARRIREAMGNIRITLDAELQGIHAYTPTSKRLDLTKLLENPRELFAPGVYKKLPAVAQNAFREAGLSIAFELPTAAAFYLMRGTEAVLREYYEQMVRQKRIASRNWGAIIVDLRKRVKTRKYEVLNDHLDNIRRSFRNPTQHPEAEYDIHEVQDLHSVCVDVVNRMIKTLKGAGKLK